MDAQTFKLEIYVRGKYKYQLPTCPMVGRDSAWVGGRQRLTKN